MQPLPPDKRSGGLIPIFGSLRNRLKRRETPFGRQPCLLPPLCVASFHLPSPRMGGTHRLSASSLEERNSVGVGTFQPSFGFKDFHHAARPHPSTGGHPGWRPPVRWWGKRARLRPLPLPRPQGFSSSRPRWRMRRVGGPPPHGSATFFFPPRLGEEWHPSVPRGLPPAMPG